MKIIGSVWFSSMQVISGMGNIGIVIINNGRSEKAYIGVGLGEDQRVDEELIAKVGAYFPLKQAKELI